jgi:hypothetical protein
MPNDNASTVDTSLAAYLRTLAGANKSVATITPTARISGSS